MRISEDTQNKIFKFCTFVLLGMFFAFAGWLQETIYCSVKAGEFVGRGFLHLPFCPIYGFTILIMYWLIGTPESGGVLLKKLTKKPLRYFIYFIIAVIVPSAAELATGLFYEKVFGVVLWSYATYKFNLFGYICLRISLTWGVLITLAMGVIFPLVRKLIERMHFVPATIISSTLSVAVLTDLAVSSVQALMAAAG